MQAQKDLIYLYCITKTKPSLVDFKDIGVKIYPIYFQDTYAIISRVLPDEFSEDNLKKNFANMEWVERKTRQHERIIEEIMKDTTVLPFKFGTIFDSSESVEKLLKEHNTEFKQILTDLEGKEELGIKIYCDLKRLRKIIEKEDERIKEKEKEIASASLGKAYLLSKKKDELIKNIINEKISEWTKYWFDKLKNKSLDAKINKILPKEVTGKEQDMVLNIAFLIDRKQRKDFEDVIGYLKTKYSNNGFTFDYTGPWPCYNFCQTQMSTD